MTKQERQERQEKREFLEALMKTPNGYFIAKKMLEDMDAEDHPAPRERTVWDEIKKPPKKKIGSVPQRRAKGGVLNRTKTADGTVVYTRKD